MNPKTMAGLKRYGKKTRTKSIAEDVEGKEGVDDPEALAVWIRKMSLGDAEFRRHQKSTRKKRAA